MNTGYVGIEDDYPISIKQVLDITAELGALETQRRVRELPKYVQPDPDTVSRQAVIENVCTMLRNCFDASDKMIESVKITIGELPPSPSRPKGRWIDRNDNVATCSVCGERWGLYRMLNFCPHCGADMRQQEGGAV